MTQLFVQPHLLVAARRAPDRAARIVRMAQVMRETELAHGACEMQHLRAADFTKAEILAYRDDALAILSGRPGADKLPSPARIEGARLAAEARRIKRRKTAGGLAHV